MRVHPLNALYLRGTKPAYLLGVTISMQNHDIFAKVMHVQYLWYACPEIMQIRLLEAIFSSRKATISGMKPRQPLGPDHRRFERDWGSNRPRLHLRRSTSPSAAWASPRRWPI